MPAPTNPRTDCSTSRSKSRDLVLRLTPKPFLENMDPEPPAPPPTRLSFYGTDRVVALDGDLKGSAPGISSAMTTGR